MYHQARCDDLYNAWLSGQLLYNDIYVALQRHFRWHPVLRRWRRGRRVFCPIKARLYHLMVRSVFAVSCPSLGAPLMLTSMVASTSNWPSADSLELSRFLPSFFGNMAVFDKTESPQWLSMIMIAHWRVGYRQWDVKHAFWTLMPRWCLSTIGKSKITAFLFAANSVQRRS